MKANKVLCQAFSSGKHRSEYIHALSSLTPFTLPNTSGIPTIAKVGIWVNISELLFHLGHLSSSFEILCNLYRDLEQSVQVHPVLFGYICCRLVMLYISIPRSFLFPESLQMLEDINSSFSKVIVELQTIKTSFSQIYVVVLTLNQYLSQWCIAIWKKNVTQANQLLAHYHSMYQRSLASLSGSIVSHTISSEEDLSLASLLGKCSLKELNGSSEVLCDVRIDCGHFLFLYKLCACVRHCTCFINIALLLSRMTFCLLSFFSPLGILDNEVWRRTWSLLRSLDKIVPWSSMPCAIVPSF